MDDSLISAGTGLALLIGTTAAELSAMSDDPAASAARRALAGFAGPLPEAASDRDGRLRALSLGALARRGALTPDLVADALTDLDPRVRRRACELATGVDVEVSALLDDPDPFVAEAAAFACGEARSLSDEGVARLIDRAGAADHPLVREAAIAALGSREDERGRGAILAALGDVVTVRRRAVIALASYEGPEIIDALEAMTRDRDWQVANAATDLLRLKSAP